MMKNYLIRLDDACPYMDVNKWQQMEDILDKYDVKPLVGLIPSNEDIQTMPSKKYPKYWEKVHGWMGKGWQMALHGYNHVYISKEAGVNPMWQRSEFAGVSLELQKEKIRRGYETLRQNGIKPDYFFAPSHTFDSNTIRALREESDIRVISDTIGRYPYKSEGFYFIPQIVGHCVKMPFPGIYTFCFHPNTMDDRSFDSLEAFLGKYSSCFIGFDQIELNKYGEKKNIDKFLSFLFFSYRSLRGLR